MVDSSLFGVDNLLPGLKIIARRDRSIIRTTIDEPEMNQETERQRLKVNVEIVQLWIFAI
jgi:hypothetical protein